jgi:broad specificity phosphatase PhoE
VTRLYLVRHGRASAGWDRHVDPGLDDVGRSQAEAMAAHLAPLGPLTLVSSPLLRCRETAEALGARWGVSATIDPAVREIPSPPGLEMEERVDWLRAAMSGTWSALDEPYHRYRDAVVARLQAIHTDTVVVSHFVAINAAVGAALGDDRVVIHRLDNCSVTVMDTDGARLSLVSPGAEADTLIR